MLGSARWDLGLRDGPDGLSFDSVLDPSLPEWTRAHIDVVLPDPFSPLGWTVIGPAFEWAQRVMVSRRLWVSALSRGGEWRHVGRIGGYAYINVSAARLIVSRSPGVALESVDEQMGLVGLMPLGARSWRDGVWFPAAVVGAVRAPILLPWDLWRQRRETRRLVGDQDRFGSMSTGELVRWLERSRRRLVRVLVAHYVLRLFGTPVVEALQRICGDDRIALGLLADLDGLAASAPARGLSEIARAARDTGAIDDAALEAFGARFGHRGRGELDPGRAVWDDQLAALRTRVGVIAAGHLTDLHERARRTRTEAVAALDGLPWPVRARARRAARLARSVSVAGERSKDDLTRSVHSIRLALREIARRANLDADDASLCSWAELRDAAGGIGPHAAELDARRHEMAGAAAATPPMYLRTDVDTTTPPPASSTILTGRLEGIGASGGHADGRAVVVTDPLEVIPDGEVLVAHSTDTAWTHLFLTHEAIITDAGDLLSHSSIVARDLGIPAVVATRTATTAIATGDHTHVDGDAGTVTYTRQPAR